MGRRQLPKAFPSMQKTPLYAVGAVTLTTPVDIACVVQLKTLVQKDDTTVTPVRDIYLCLFTGLTK